MSPPSASSGERLPRLLALVPWLQSRPGVSVAEAAAAFDVSEQQLTADIELLFCCGLPGGGPDDLIDIDMDGDRITVRDPQTLGRPLRLTAAEVTALKVATRVLADLPGLHDRSVLERALAKLEALSTGGPVAAVSAGGGGAAGPGVLAVTVPEFDGAVVAALREGVDRRRQLRLRYLVESRDEITERVVDPLHLEVRDGHLYLEAYCRRAEALRLFRSDRIRDVDVLDGAAAPPPTVSPRDFTDGLFQPAPADPVVTVDVDATARWVGEYYAVDAVQETDGAAGPAPTASAPRASLPPLPAGWTRLVLRVGDPGWLVSLALRLGGHLRVAAPPEVRDAVVAAAADAVAAYE